MDGPGTGNAISLDANSSPGWTAAFLRPKWWVAQEFERTLRAKAGAGGRTTVPKQKGTRHNLRSTNPSGGAFSSASDLARLETRVVANSALGHAATGGGRGAVLTR
jgi:hypothetical protein